MWDHIQRYVVRTGSLRVDVTAPERFFTFIIDRFFRFPRHLWQEGSEADFTLAVTFAPFSPHQSDYRSFETGLTTLYLWDDHAVIAATTSPTDDVESHLHIAISKWLFLLNRVHLHAAAISFCGKTSIFFGEKGAGKSTISLSLAHAGGTILAEDHIILQRSGDGFMVSGCDSHMRVTGKTEAHFFPGGLPEPTADYAGVLKKQIVLTDYLDAEPYVPYPVDRLFFPSVGSIFHASDMRTMEALHDLIESIRPYHRFEDSRDQLAFIDFFGQFVDSVTVQRLSLSPDLGELDKLVKMLS